MKNKKELPDNWVAEIDYDSPEFEKFIKIASRVSGLEKEDYFGMKYAFSIEDTMDFCGVNYLSALPLNLLTKITMQDVIDYYSEDVPEEDKEDFVFKPDIKTVNIKAKVTSIASHPRYQVHFTCEVCGSESQRPVSVWKGNNPIPFCESCLSELRRIILNSKNIAK